MGIAATILPFLQSCHSGSSVDRAEQEKPERAVFGEEPAKAEEGRRRVAASEAPRPRPETHKSEESARDAVTRITYRWAQTLTSRDLNAHMNLYARKLDRFYDRTNVQRESVRREKHRLLGSRAGTRIRDVSLKERDGGEIVIAEFRRTGNPMGVQTPAGSVHQRLVWKRLAAGEWKIIREEAL
jgi:ketosteroid isomerase-like protein